MTKRTEAAGATGRAALYALGALSPQEARAFEEQIAAGDGQAESELAAFRAVVDELAHAAPPQSPPPALRERVLARIASDDAARIEQGGQSFVRGDRIDWQPGSVQGVEVKPLSVDAERRRRTILVRMAPGTIYPAHRHADIEEIYMLEGDYLISGIVMRTGDYCRAEAGSVHEDSRTLSGCVFIVTASMQDQPVA